MKAAKPALPDLKKEIPAALQVPDSWAESFGDDDPDINYALSKQKRVAEAFDGLLNMRSNRNPHSTAAAHLQEIDRHAKRVAEQSQKHVEEARGKLSERIVALDSKLTDELGKDDPHGPETRQALREMDAAQRTAYVREAISAGNRRVISAVLSAPAVVSGLADKDLPAFRAYAAKQLFPSVVAEREKLEKADSFLHEVGQHALALASKAAPNEEQRKAFQAEQAQHEANLLKLSGLD